MKNQNFYFITFVVIVLIVIINFLPVEWSPKINPLPSCFVPFSNKNGKKSTLKVISVDLVKHQYRVEIISPPGTKKESEEILKGMMTEEEILEMPKTECPQE